MTQPLTYEQETIAYHDKRKHYYVTLHLLDDVFAESREEAIHKLYKKYERKGYDLFDIDVDECYLASDEEE